jgi:hypothetical protein
MGVTLVSISRITAAGHKAIFDGPSLKISDSTRKLLGEIPVSEGLYCVEHTESTHTAMETVTVNDLHRRMGHIAPDAVKLLVKKGILREFISMKLKVYAPVILVNLQKPVARQLNVSV